MAIASGNFICCWALTQLKFLLHTFEQFVCNSSRPRTHKKQTEKIHPTHLAPYWNLPQLSAETQSPPEKTWTRFILMHFLFSGRDFCRGSREGERRVDLMVDRGIGKNLCILFVAYFHFGPLFVMKAELSSKSCDHNLALSTNCHSPFSHSLTLWTYIQIYIYKYICYIGRLSLDQHPSSSRKESRKNCRRTYLFSYLELWFWLWFVCFFSLWGSGRKNTRK